MVKPVQMATEVPLPLRLGREGDALQPRSVYQALDDTYQSM